MTQTAFDSATQEISFLKRMQRLWPFFGKQRGVWLLALMATLVAACTEPLIPALFKPLLDDGFAEKSLPLSLSRNTPWPELPMTACRPCERPYFSA
jgi:subfamily B ATP-binding cassette protein MsbA